MKAILLSLFARPLTNVQWLSCCLWALAPAIAAMALRSLLGNHFPSHGLFFAMAAAHAAVSGTWVAAHMPAVLRFKLLAGLLTAGVFFSMNFVPFVEGLGCCGTTK